MPLSMSVDLGSSRTQIALVFPFTVFTLCWSCLWVAVQLRGIYLHWASDSPRSATLSSTVQSSRSQLLKSRSNALAGGMCRAWKYVVFLWSLIVLARADAPRYHKETIRKLQEEQLHKVGIYFYSPWVWILNIVVNSISVNCS